MTASTLTQIAQLRLLVGFLGEQSQCNWWSSAFFTLSSKAFFAPLFSKTAFIAQYHGVKEAAARVHDEHIGVGKVYHLFRLPEHIEQALYSSLQDFEFVDSLTAQLTDQDHALESLSTLASTAARHAEGPVFVGEIDRLLEADTLRLLAQYYLSAFTENTRTYPYYVERK